MEIERLNTQRVDTLPRERRRFQILRATGRVSCSVKAQIDGLVVQSAHRSPGRSCAHMANVRYTLRDNAWSGHADAAMGMGGNEMHSIRLFVSWCTAWSMLSQGALNLFFHIFGAVLASCHTSDRRVFLARRGQCYLTINCPTTRGQSSSTAGETRHTSRAEEAVCKPLASGWVSSWTDFAGAQGGVSVVYQLPRKQKCFQDTEGLGYEHGRERTPRGCRGSNKFLACGAAAVEERRRDEMAAQSSHCEALCALARLGRPGCASTRQPGWDSHRLAHSPMLSRKGFAGHQCHHQRQRRQGSEMIDIRMFEEPSTKGVSAAERQGPGSGEPRAASSVSQTPGRRLLPTVFSLCTTCRHHITNLQSVLK